MRRALIIVVMLVLSRVTMAGEPLRRGVEFTVSCRGDDANPGTVEKPFASIAQAQKAVRRQLAANSALPVTVWLRGGVYRLPETLVFGPEDSTSYEGGVTYAAWPGETVTLSGGRKIGGWQRGPGELWANGPAEVWRTVVPEVKEGNWMFRCLFVDGHRAIRARTPNCDAPATSYWRLQGVDYQGRQGLYVLKFGSGVLGNWTNPADIEVMVAGSWEINRKRVHTVEPQANRVTLAPPHYRGPGHAFPTAGRWGYFENAREFLDQPGEWYLDKSTGTVWYWPLPGQDMTAVEVVTPVLECLIAVTGTRQTPVGNLHFRGLHLVHTQWPLPETGFMGTQACHYSSPHCPDWRGNHIPAAVTFTATEHCTIKECMLSHLGGCGLDLSDRCRDSLVQGNHVYDVSGNGIMVGGQKKEEEIPKINRVDNNCVHGCGVDFYGAVGIWVGFAENTVVSHNLVYDLPYTGISVGWEWGPKPAPCKANQVEYNHVYDVMNLLCDGAAIYTLGWQPGTTLRGNHLHDVHRSPLATAAPNNGIFMDEGSKGFAVEQNVIYATSGEPVRFNCCDRQWHTWQDNEFGIQGEAAVGNIGRETIRRAGLELPWRERFAPMPSRRTW